jgi:acetyl-CoA synthetase
VPAADTGCDDPCLMIYTSGTTGPAKGALHGHRVLAGHMPGFLFAHGGSVSVEDVFYTPADWAWAGGLLNLLFPALSLGAPVVSFSDAKGFDPARVAAMMAERGVTHAFLPPTALKLMRASVSDETMRGIGLRSVMSAGEALGRATYEWAERAFGFAISEAYGQTECNLIIGSSATYGATRAGATGKAGAGT